MPRILLIEDAEVDIAGLRERVQRRFGGEAAVVPARSMKTALDLLNHGNWDHVVLDLRIDSSDGVETYQRVAQAAGNVPITVWSGNAVPPHVSQTIPVPVHIREDVEAVVESVNLHSQSPGEAELAAVLREILKTIALVSERISEAGQLAKEGRERFEALRAKLSSSMEANFNAIQANRELVQASIAHNTEVLRELKTWAAVLKEGLDRLEVHLDAEAERKEIDRTERERWSQWRAEKADQLIGWLTSNPWTTWALGAASVLLLVGGSLWVLTLLGVDPSDVARLLPTLQFGE